MPLVGFEPAIPASGRPQTQILDRAAIGIGTYTMKWNTFLSMLRAQQVNVARDWGGGTHFDIVLNAS